MFYRGLREENDERFSSTVTGGLQVGLDSALVCRYPPA
jgi:hypothetical protein